jgi:quercetin 2,3-dioxygenase
MATQRPVVRTLAPQKTVDGAGVSLYRVFSRELAPLLDPFLMLDHFGSDKPEDYQAGFPWHPHRGIETVTYLLAGQVEHSDSLGNKGRLGPGDLQWMTAASGIIHQEMPEPGPDGRLEGFQLWVNLRAADKMAPPAYRDFAAAQIPAQRSYGATIKVVAGAIGGEVGPVRGIGVEPLYLDITLGPSASLDVPTPINQTAFAYLYRGSCAVGAEGTMIEGRRLVIFGPGEAVRLRAEAAEARLLLVAGTPLHESIAWGGPIVMNTHEELQRAFRELDEGSFIKAKPVR